MTTSLRGRRQVGLPARSIEPADVRKARPFLKWAGGKRQLLPILRTFYPASFKTYFEPFVGSGAVFFDLAARERLGAPGAVLSDVNWDVIGCFQAVRRDVSAVVRLLHRLAIGHARAGTAHYYAIRDDRFNPQRRHLSESPPSGASEIPYSAALAAMLIYLNRTGYNGLFRLNRGGGFNVPVGRYHRPRICDEPNLRAVAATLAAPRTDVTYGGFDAVLARAEPGDFVYLDPPYVPLSATARFTSYTAEGFDSADQLRLQEAVFGLARRGCHVLLSNSAAPATVALYEENREAWDAGLRTFRVPARRAINSRASQRGPVDELIVTNVEPPDGTRAVSTGLFLGVN